MNFLRAPLEEPKVNLTPLIDVVFLLLIFFMVSTSFEKQTALKISLPKASQQAELKKDDAIEVAIDAEGRMYVNQQGLLNSRAATLKAALTAAAGSNRSVPVVLRADGETAHHYVVTTMDVLAKMGFSNLSIAAATEAEEQ
ncbi:MAG: biopolymer transporter ExbD [Xanthomonadales bacterium]|nr:biopolymer transporter ExbD [Xanthomonadales bacterium]